MKTSTKILMEMRTGKARLFYTKNNTKYVINKAGNRYYVGELGAKTKSQILVSEMKQILKTCPYTLLYCQK